MQPYTDEHLMLQVRQRDGAALEALYDRYAKLVYSFAMKASPDVQLAKEVVQLVFTRLWTTDSGYDAGKGLFVNWLLTITRNIVIDQLRRARRQPAVVPFEPAAWEALPDHLQLQPEAAAARAWVKERLEDASRTLTERQQQLIRAFYWEGYTLSEIAERSGEPLGTVKNRLHQALKQLRKQMAAEKEEVIE